MRIGMSDDHDLSLDEGEPFDSFNKSLELQPRDRNLTIMTFSWSVGHPPSQVSVVFQIVILHVLAVILGVVFFFLRRYLIYQRNQRLEGSKRLYAVCKPKTIPKL